MAEGIESRSTQGGAPVGLTATHPLLDRPRVLPGSGDLADLTAGVVSVQPSAAMVLVRAVVPGAAADALAQELGVALPTRPNTWVRCVPSAPGRLGTDSTDSTEATDGTESIGGPEGTIVWLGPDEWLVIDPSSTPWHLEERLRAVAASEGGSGGGWGGGSATDVSAQRVALRIQGPHARDLLSSGCSLDTHPSVFPGGAHGGAAAQTLLAQAAVVVLARSEAGGDYEVLVRSSFARYLADWLTDACVEYLTPTA